jgi:hypothetical protein
VQSKVLKFFSAYDASRDLNILVLKRTVDMKKKWVRKIRTVQAYDYAEKSEMENLFLDCIDHCKREHFKQESNNLDVQTSEEGIIFSVNGIIKKVNLNSLAGELKNILLLDKGGLICIFEEIFGHNK